MNIVFMGSPVEACESLKILLAHQDAWQVKVQGVVSQPARPAGRKKKLLDPPVATFAKERELPLLQPEKARAPDFLDQLRVWAPDVIVTAAYGQILSEEFLAIPKRATINIHPSLLPKYRGATPIPSALLNGDTNSGVTVLFTVKKLDAGAIICQREVDFGISKTTGDLMPELFALGGDMLGDAFEKLKDHSFAGEEQDESQVTHCGKFTKQDGLIDWQQSATIIVNRYRAFTPWPGVFTFHNGIRVKLTQIEACLDTGPTLSPGGFAMHDGALLVGTSEGTLKINRLMRAGGKEMDGRGFMNGLKEDAPRFFSLEVEA